MVTMPGEGNAHSKPQQHLLAGLTIFDASRLTYEAAIRASLGNFLPLITLYFLDRVDLGIYAAFAAFTSIYGRSEPYRSRWLSVGVAALALLACILAGISVQLAGAPLWLMFSGAAALILITLPLSYMLELIPKGSIFFLFAFLACSNYPVPAEGVGIAMLTAAGSAATSWCIAMSGWILRRIPLIAVRLRPLPHMPHRRLSEALKPEILSLTAVTAIGTLTAGIIAWSLNLASHEYWAMLAVVAIFTAPSATVSFARTMQRVVGTMAGVGLASALYGGSPPTLYVILVCAICAFIVEVVIGQHYGVALGFITPLALGSSNLTSHFEWETLFVDRSRETLIGGFVAFVIILLTRYRLQRRGELH